MDLIQSVTLGVYALFATSLCILLVSIDLFGRALLPRTKTLPGSAERRTESNPAGGHGDGAARVLAAHRNALANIVPFLVLMFLYVLLGASTRSVLGLCGVFTAMRVAHAIVHIRGVPPPWRTIPWLVAQVCLFVVMFQVARAALAIV